MQHLIYVTWSGTAGFRGSPTLEKIPISIILFVVCVPLGAVKGRDPGLPPVWVIGLKVLPSPHGHGNLRKGTEIVKMLILYKT